MPKRVLHALGQLIAYAGLLCWFAAFAYADWLRFISPKQPDPATGRVVYEKAVKGVFYITTEQAFWAQTILTPIWLTAVGGILLIAATHEKGREDGITMPRLIVSAIILAGPVALLLFGDEIMSFLFTGSPLPPTPKA